MKERRHNKKKVIPRQQLLVKLMQSKSELIKNYSNKTRSLRNLLVSCGTIATLISTTYAFKTQIKQTFNSIGVKVGHNEQELFKASLLVKEASKNKTEYIDAYELNLVSLAKLKHASMFIQLASKIKTKQFYDKISNELVKLNDLDDAYVQILQQQLMNDTDLTVHLAFNSKIDNRLFRKEPPTAFEQFICNHSSIGTIQNL